MLEAKEYSSRKSTVVIIVMGDGRVCNEGVLCFSACAAAVPEFLGLLSHFLLPPSVPPKEEKHKTFHPTVQIS